MLEYTLDDAESLLTKNYNAALKSLEVVDNDLSFLRDQTTTIEVSILSGVIITSEAEELQFTLLYHYAFNICSIVICFFQPILVIDLSF